MLMVINRVSAISNLGDKWFVKIRSFDRKILSQGMAFITIPEENPPQVGMVNKMNPKEIIDLSLQPVGCFPDRFHPQNRFISSNLRLQPEPFLVLHRAESINNLKARGFRKVIYPTKIGKEMKLEVRIGIEKLTDLNDLSLWHGNGGFFPKGLNV